MRIKKDQKTRNEFISAAGYWIRNFTKSDSQFIDINTMIKDSDHLAIIRNEILNRTLGIANIADEKYKVTQAVIVSDGYQFDQRHKILSKLPNVVVVAINRSLVKWSLGSERPINAYLVNNPYRECLDYLPRKLKYYPMCVASSRTYTDFLKQYQGNMYLYDSTPNSTFGHNKNSRYFIDDYRNPICGAIGLLYRLGVKKLMLMCCDDSFEDERAGAERLSNGLWTYPQHNINHEIVDANLYWLTHQENEEVIVGDYSNGLEYKNAVYIKDEEAVLNFFQDEARKD